VACVTLFVVLFIYVMTRPVKEYMVYYINLDHRHDRNREVLQELNKLPRGAIVERVSAVYEKDRGHLGCSKSHVKALEKFIQSGRDTCIIFEDDFEFVSGGPRRLGNFLNGGFSFDVVMVSTNDIESEPCEYQGFKKVTDAQTASGYIVSKDFAPILLNNFKQGANLLERDYDNHSAYAIDQYWKRLQPSSKWYSFDPPCGRQRKSYSDIQGGVVEYTL
jgi:glycosyl transferase family 25